MKMIEYVYMWGKEWSNKVIQKELNRGQEAAADWSHYLREICTICTGLCIQLNLLVLMRPKLWRLMRRWCWSPSKLKEATMTIRVGCLVALSMVPWSALLCMLMTAQEQLWKSKSSSSSRLVQICLTDGEAMDTLINLRAVFRHKVPATLHGSCSPWHPHARNWGYLESFEVRCQEEGPG